MSDIDANAICGTGAINSWLADAVRVYVAYFHAQTGTAFVC